jgi:glutathione S-transferase
MLIFYASDHSLYCSKTRILLDHKGLAFDERPAPGGTGSDAYRAIVPSGTIPALVHGDLTLGDSEAIAEYLEEAFPDPPMMPTGAAARAKARERSRFHDTRLEPALRLTFPIVKAGGEGDVTGALEAIALRLDQLAAMLDMPHTTLTLGDCGMPVTFDWIDCICDALVRPMDWPAPVVEYRTWLNGFEAVRTERAVRQPIMRDWVASRVG